MKKNVKKGFTLVELVAALAILTTSIVVIYQVFKFSNNVWVKEKNNIKLVSISQTISQTLKGSGKDHLATIYNNGEGTKIYFYFDSIDEAVGIANGIDTNKLKAIVGSSDIYSKNESKDYGAQLIITPKELKKWDYASYTYYQVDIKIWKLDKLNAAPTSNPEISTVASFYIT